MTDVLSGEEPYASSLDTGDNFPFAIELVLQGFLPYPGIEGAPPLLLPAFAESVSVAQCKMRLTMHSKCVFGDSEHLNTSHVRKFSFSVYLQEEL